MDRVTCANSAMRAISGTVPWHLCKVVRTLRAAVAAVLWHGRSGMGQGVALPVPACDRGRVPQPVLRTARLLLVPLAGRHLGLEIELDSDPEVLRYLGGRARSAAEVAESHARRMALTGNQLSTVEFQRRGHPEPDSDGAV